MYFYKLIPNKRGISKFFVILFVYLFLFNYFNKWIFNLTNLKCIKKSKAFSWMGEIPFNMWVAQPCACALHAREKANQF